MTDLRSTTVLRLGTLVLTLIVTISVDPASAPAQQPATQPGGKSAGTERTTREGQPWEFHVIRLKNANAIDLAQVLASVVEPRSGGKVVPDPVSNSLLISAMRPQVETLKALVVQLDDSARERVARPESRTSVLELRSVVPDKFLEEALKLVFRNTTGNFALDRTNKQVVISADVETTQAAIALLARLDREVQERHPKDVQVRVLWLVNGPGDGAAPPDDVKDALPGLDKLGLKTPRVAAQTVINVSPNARFRASGVAKLDTPCQFSVTGQTRDARDQSSVMISIRALRDRSGREGARPPEEICNIETEISAPSGHLVLLGVTPTDSLTSAFLVQMTVTK